MKVAIVHDLLFEYGGAERVLDGLLRIYPQADLYTFYFNGKDLLLKKYSKQLIGSSLLTKIPDLNKLGSFFSVFKLISWIYFFSLNLKKYDVIISSTHSYGAKIVRKAPSAFHISYIHTSPRYLYGEGHELLWLSSFPGNIFFYPIRQILILIDKLATKNPDVLLANSKNTQQKIKKHYNRTATLIYPPVFVQGSSKKEKKYFVAQGRLVRQKGFELIIRTCNLLKLPLVVIGEGYYKKYLQFIAGKTIFFAGSLSDEKVSKLYQHAYALLYAADADDFGLVPAESIVRGVPVIGYHTGGLREILIDGKNGIAYTEYSIKSLANAVLEFMETKIDSGFCVKSVEKCSWQNFRKKILKVVHEKS